MTVGTMDDPEDEDARQQRLTDWVVSQELCLSHGIEVDFEWMQENIGDRRPFHPYREARSGWIDYFDGEWAVETCGDHVCYWFWRLSSMVKFRLMYGGTPSERLRARRWYG